MNDWLIGTHITHKTDNPAATYAQAKSIGAGTFQIFVGSPTSGLRKPLSDKAIAAFVGARKLMREGTPAYNPPVFMHAPYSINAAMAEDAHSLFARSANAAAALDIVMLFHAGSSKTTSPSSAVTSAAIANVAAHVDAALIKHPRLRIVYEFMHGSPSSGVIGKNLQELAALIAATEHRERVGICIDTAHVYSSGTDISTPQAMDAFWRDYDRIVGPGYLSAIHLNDADRGCKLGSGQDRHAHIGEGSIGLASFKQMLSDRPRFSRIPIITETHYTEIADMAGEIAMLRRLCKA